MSSERTRKSWKREDNTISVAGEEGWPCYVLEFSLIKLKNVCGEGERGCGWEMWEMFHWSSPEQVTPRQRECGTGGRKEGKGAGARDTWREGWGRGCKVCYSVHRRPRVNPQNHKNPTKHNRLELMVGTNRGVSWEEGEREAESRRKSRIMKWMMASFCIVLETQIVEPTFPSAQFMFLLLLGFCFIGMRSCCIPLTNLSLMAILLPQHLECITISSFQVHRVVNLWFCLLRQGLV